MISCSSRSVLFLSQIIERKIGEFISPSFSFSFEILTTGQSTFRFLNISVSTKTISYLPESFPSSVKTLSFLLSS